MLDIVYGTHHQFSISSKIHLDSRAQRLKTTIPRLTCSYDSGYNLGSASKMHLFEIWKVEKR